jgi:L-ascorbate metabolism protein UlaG (beta-lactamase superfamily)
MQRVLVVPRRLISFLALVPFLVLASCSGESAVLGILGRNLVQTWVPIRPAPHHPTGLVKHNAHLAVTWIGHATTLVQIDDKLVLTDPLLCATAGLVSKRLVAAAVKPRELPRLDAVVVSHMHFDHLSYDSLFALRDKVTSLLLPAGGSSYVPDYGFPQVELSPWQSWEQDGLRITAVPVKHVGWRWGLDALWNPESFTGYVFEYHGLKVYFGGDTAYVPENFRAVHERFPDLDLALLPIAPLEPRSFMSRTHQSADEAVQAFQLLGAKLMVPIHFDTFINSADQVGDAGQALAEAMAAHQITDAQVVKLEIGEQRVLAKK